MQASVLVHTHATHINGMQELAAGKTISKASLLYTIAVESPRGKKTMVVTDLYDSDDDEDSYDDDDDDDGNHYENYDDDDDDDDDD